MASPTKRRQREPECLIHILRSNAAMCGREGDPIDWQLGEIWLGPEDAWLANCPGCIEATGYTRPQLKKICGGRAHPR